MSVIIIEDLLGMVIWRGWKLQPLSCCRICALGLSPRHEAKVHVLMAFLCGAEHGRRSSMLFLYI